MLLLLSSWFFVPGASLSLLAQLGPPVSDSALGAWIHTGAEVIMVIGLIVALVRKSVTEVGPQPLQVSAAPSYASAGELARVAEELAEMRADIKTDFTEVFNRLNGQGERLAGVEALMKTRSPK